MSLNPDIIRSIYDAYDSGDFEEILSAFAPDVEIVISEPWHGVYHGVPGTRDFLNVLMHYFQATIETEWLAECGDHVVHVGRTAGEVRETGKAFSFAHVHVWRIADGKVVSLRPFVEPAAGVVPLREALSEEHFGASD